MSKMAPTKVSNSLLINLCHRRWTKRFRIVSLRGRGAESVRPQQHSRWAPVRPRRSCRDPRLRPHSSG